MAMSGTAPTPIPPPLRLPTGSIRAILALTLCGTLWYTTIRSIAAPIILVDSALLVVAFYFGERSGSSVIPAQSAQLSGETPKVRDPLFLPRGSVRTVLALGFLGVTAYVYYRDRSVPETLLLVFQVIASYAVGYAFSLLLLRRARAGKGMSRSAAVARNFVSLAAIGITGAVSWAILVGRFDLVPDYLQNGLAWTLAFYFGSRLVA